MHLRDIDFEADKKNCYSLTILATNVEHILSRFVPRSASANKNSHDRFFPKASIIVNRYFLILWVAKVGDAR